MKKNMLLLCACLALAPALQAQIDTVPPQLVCKNLPAVGLFLCNLTLFATDFIDSLTDDYSSTAEIQLGLRKQCVGWGFPAQQNHVTYTDGNDYGYQTVEVFARDKAGNTQSCTAHLWITETATCCLPSHQIGIAHTFYDEEIDSVFFEIKGQDCLSDTLNIAGYTSHVPWSPSVIFESWEGPSRPGYDLAVTPTKSLNPLNGVAPNDLSQISKHILGIEPFSSPYQFIAADANLDGKLNIQDIILLRQLMLGLVGQFPHGKSWRFVPYSFVFPNPSSPFSVPFPEKILVSNTDDPVPTYFNFKGIKIGDVDFSADPDQ